MEGINAELVTEYAKDKVWENNDEAFKNQAYIFGKQSYRISRCDGKVDVIITDSPLPLSIIYNKNRLSETFNQLVMEVFNNYNNINFFIRRVKKYNPVGRFQTEKESDALADEIQQLLDNRNIDYTIYNGDIDGYNQILFEIVKKIGDKDA